MFLNICIKLIRYFSLISCASYVEEPEATLILQGVLKHYLRFKEYPRAMIIALQLNDKDKCEEIFKQCEDP